VSHDLKAPLRGIASLADWLQKDYGDRLDDEGRDMLQMMSGRVRRMSDLIDGVLQYSRVGRVREDKNIIDLQALVHNTINAIAPPSGIKIEIDTNLPTLLAEKHRMHQVFQKLQQAIADLQQENQERLKIEDSLRESQKRFESLAAVAPVGIYRTNTTGDCIYVNDRWCEIAGLTAAEASGPNWARALHPEDRQKVGTEWYASVQKRRPFELECRFQKPDGTITWVLSRARAERDIYGEIIGYVGTITDISDRKQAEAELKQLNATLEVRVESRTRELQEREKNLEESQRLLQTVLDVFPLAVFWKDRQSILLGCNQVFAIAAGVTSPSEAVGKSNFDFSYSEEEKLKYTLDDRSVMESGVPKIGIHETITLANGEIQWIETNKIPLRDELGEVVGIVGTFQDISDRKFAEEALAESEAFNRQLVEEFPIGLASCRMDGQLVYVNSAFAKILGRTIEETLELTYWDITPIKYADQEAAQLESLQLEGRYSSYEKEYIHKDGYLVPVLLNGLVILQKGELIIWSSVQDISDRKQSETKLQLANEELMRATRLKDEFLANMSHELRTPLNSILGMNESLQDEVFGSINKRQLKALQTIESSSTHLLTLINDILDVAKIESGQITLNLTVTNIESLCTSSLAFIKQQALTKRVQLTARIPKDLPEIMLDERRMRQVLINLLNNAIKFTLEGGKITLEVSQVQLESSTTNLTLLNYLKIAV
ncbi:MAG: PAS domain S-box protein, partial [Pseudanabaena sp.]